MYKFSSNISKEEYNTFLIKFNNTPVTQEYNWAEVKSGWDNAICGLYDDNKLVAATLLLVKKLPLGIKMIYSPRGFLIDYTNEKLLKEFTKGIKSYAKKIHAFLVKIDPLYAVNEYSVDNKKDIPINFIKNNKEKSENLLKCGFIHKGYKKEIGAYIQPRFNMMVPLIDSNNNVLSKEEVIENLKKKNKNQLGDYHTKRGVMFSNSSDVKDIDEFYDLICHTERRQNIALRDKNYFIRMLKSYGDRARIFSGKLDLDIYLDFLISEHPNDKDYVEEKKKQINEIKKEKGNIISICTAMVILPINTHGIRVMEYLYAGSNVLSFSNLNIPLGLIYNILLFGIENNCHYCNLGGVDGKLNDHLTIFKSKSNPILIEYVGEFDLVINRFYYMMFEKLLPSIKKAIKLIKR